MSKIKPSYCFPPLFRLRNGAQIQEVLCCAKKHKERNLSVFIKPNDLNHLRLAVIIANKHVSKAVHRNRIKRIVRENLRLNQDKIKGNDIIVFGYRGIENLTNTELKQCITNSWQKLL